MTENKKRLLIDTSVMRGIFDDDTPDTKACTGRFWDKCRTGAYELFVCIVFDEEMKNAPREQTEPIEDIVKELGIERLPRNKDAEQLANDYKGKPLKTAMGDRRHLAYATEYECDTVVSWNMKDIVNADTYRGINGVNMGKGKKTITVETPAMLLGEEEPEWLP